MNLTLLEDSSNYHPTISGDQPQNHITSLHDSVPSLNTNIHQNYGMEDSNLVPITEEDEKSSINYNHEQLQAGEFKRGGVARSTIRNSKKKNFKQLKLDMTVCRNNLATDDHDDDKFVEDTVLTDEVKPDPTLKIEIVDTPDSPFTPLNIEAMKADKNNFEKVDPKNNAEQNDPIPKPRDIQLKDTSKDLLSTSQTSSPLSENQSSPNLMASRNDSTSPNLPTVSSKESLNLLTSSKSPNLSSSSMKLVLYQDLSLSEGEEMFEDLSNEIADELSEDEEIFDKISMNIDLKNIDEEFQVTLNEHIEQVEPKMEIDSEKIQSKNEKPTDKVDIKESEEEETDVVLRKPDLKKDIAYWEKRASDSAESRVLNKSFNENFKRGTFQRSTIKKSRKKVSSLDMDLKSNRSSTSETTSKILSAQNDLLKMTSVEKSANADPYFDGKNSIHPSNATGCSSTHTQSITPKPAPRKKFPPLQLRCQEGRTKILVRNDTNDQSSRHLPKLDSSVRTFQFGTRIIFSIKTWEQRRKEPNRSIPTKQLVEWF